MILSLIDVEMQLRPARVSVGMVTYPPGGTLGPRTQADLQLVLIQAGSAKVWIDDAPHRLTAGQVGLLLPGHRERFEFDAHVATRHSWLQAEVPALPRGPSERQVPRCAARRPSEHPRHQRETRRRIVAHGRDLGRGRGERDCVVTHRA